MAKEHHDPREAHFANYYAVALKCTFSVCRLSWTCPQCGAGNHSDFDGTRLRKYHDWAIRARCGKCHANTITLLDAKHRTIEPKELLPRPR